MKISSWGKYFRVESKNIAIADFGHGVTPVGSQSSYNNINENRKSIKSKKDLFKISMKNDDFFLECSASCTIAEIIENLSTEGLFPMVVPGTKNVTIGGAIAANIHGKNHHNAGSFCDSVEEIKMKLRDGSILNIKKDDDEMFDICGCFGLVGLILSAKIKLKKIGNLNSFISRKIISSSLKESMYLLSKNEDDEYNVCWLNTTPFKKENIGEGVYMAGTWVNTKENSYIIENKLNIPILPSFVLNNISLRFLNIVHFFSEKIKINLKKERFEDFNTFLFPLDKYNNWDNAYGKKGMLQCQIVTANSESLSEDLLEKILILIYEKKAVSFITILKKFGNKKNSAFFNKGLNFQQENGYTLAMDFPATNENLNIIRRIENLTFKLGGNIYLAKNPNSNSAEKILYSKERKDWFKQITNKYNIQKKDYPDFFRNKVNFLEKIVIIGANSTIVQDILLETDIFEYSEILFTTSTGTLKNRKEIFKRNKNKKSKIIKLDLRDESFLKDKDFLNFLQESDFLLLGSGILDSKASIDDVFKINQYSLISIVQKYIEKTNFYKKNICFLSSVTTMRGKKSTLAYSASKRAVELFLEGLELEENIDIYVPRLGFVDTKMTKGMELPNILTSKSKIVAKQIENMILKNKTGIRTLSKRWILAEMILKHLPKKIWKKIDERK